MLRVWRFLKIWNRNECEVKLYTPLPENFFSSTHWKEFHWKMHRVCTRIFWNFYTNSLILSFCSLSFPLIRGTLLNMLRIYYAICFYMWENSWLERFHIHGWFILHFMKLPHTTNWFYCNFTGFWNDKKMNNHDDAKFLRFFFESSQKDDKV